MPKTNAVASAKRQCPSGDSRALTRFNHTLHAYALNPENDFERVKTSEVTCGETEGLVFNDKISGPTVTNPKIRPGFVSR